FVPSSFNSLAISELGLGKVLIDVSAHECIHWVPPRGDSNCRCWWIGDSASALWTPSAHQRGRAIGAAMSAPPELIRFFGRLTPRSVLAPLSVPGGLIGIFALLMTPVAESASSTGLCALDCFSRLDVRDRHRLHLLVKQGPREVADRELSARATTDKNGWR